MKNDLIERYVYAVTKNLPGKIRKDIEKELYTLIDDMLESRCGEVTPTERDIRVVLTELGTPSELAEKYSPDADKYLIGPQYYGQYKFLLTIIIAATAFGLTIASLVSTIMTSDAKWYLAIPAWFGTTIMGLLNAFAFVTILFVIFQSKGIKVNMAHDNLDNLPPVPKKNEVIHKYESIFGIAISIIFCVVFLIAPEILGVAFVDGEGFIPIFNPEIIRSIWYIILGFTALGIIRESFKLHEGRYTKKLAGVTIVTDILSAILSFVFLLDNNIINPGFRDAISNLFEKDSEFIANIFSNFNLFFLGVILFALILDIANTVVRAIKYDN